MIRRLLVILLLLSGCSQKNTSREEPLSLPLKQVAAPMKLPLLTASIPALITGKLAPSEVMKRLKPFLLAASLEKVKAIREALSPQLVTRKKGALDVALGLWLRPKSRREEELPDPLFLDVSGDGMPDLIALPEIFFGPSPGYTLILRQKGRYVMRWGGAGNFTMVAVTGGHLLLAYTLDTIDEKEARVHHLVSLKRGVQGVTATATLFLARQTIIPPLSEPVSWSFSKELHLLAAPAGAPPSKQRADVSQLLKGGVVARYGSGATGYRFARKGRYGFGCLLPTAPLMASGLRHGMDNASFDEKRGRVIYGRETPWICGWAAE